MAHLHNWLQNSLISAPENPSRRVAIKSRGILGSIGAFLKIAFKIESLDFWSGSGM